MASEIVKVRLEVELHAYKKISLVIRDHKNMLSMLKINDLVKKDLIRDVDIIRRILENSEVGEIQNGRS